MVHSLLKLYKAAHVAIILLEKLQRLCIAENGKFSHHFLGQKNLFHLTHFNQSKYKPGLFQMPLVSPSNQQTDRSKQKPRHVCQVSACLQLRVHLVRNYGSHQSEHRF